MKTPNTSPQAIELNPVQDVLGKPISKGLVLALGTKTRRMDVLLESSVLRLLFVH